MHAGGARARHAEKQARKEKRASPEDTCELREAPFRGRKTACGAAKKQAAVFWGLMAIRTTNKGRTYESVLWCLGVLFFTAPSFAYAQLSSVAEAYCPDGKIFTGSIAHENGRPWIEPNVDSLFAAKMEALGYPTGLPVTPVYDLAIRIKPAFNYYCIPGWLQEPGQPEHEVVAGDLPASVPIKGTIVVGEG